MQRRVDDSEYTHYLTISNLEPQGTWGVPELKGSGPFASQSCGRASENDFQCCVEDVGHILERLRLDLISPQVGSVLETKCFFN